MQGTLLALIVVLVVFFLVFARAREKPSTRLVKTKDRTPLPPIEKDDVCVPYDDSPGALVIPLVSDENNIFNIELSVNGHWVQAAVDTGSEALLIGGEDCSKCRLGSPSQGQVPMPDGKPATSMMRYGSQQDKVAWDVRPVRLRGWKYTCDEMDDDHALTDQDDPPHKPVCIVGDVQMAIVQDRSGTSNYNILGLGARTLNGPPSFLQAMFPTLPRAFSVLIQSENDAKLILRKPTATCHPPKHLFAVDRGDMHSHQYLLRMDRLAVDDSPMDVDLNRFRLMLDTGANAISAPTEMYRFMARTARKGRLEVGLTDKDGKPASLSFEYNMDDRYNAQVLDGGGSKLIIGCTFMIGMAVGVHQNVSGTYVSIDY